MKNSYRNIAMGISSEQCIERIDIEVYVYD